MTNRPNDEKKVRHSSLEVFVIQKFIILLISIIKGWFAVADQGFIGKISPTAFFKFGFGFRDYFFVLE